MTLESPPPHGALLGRAPELSALQQALQEAAQSGRSVLMRGDAGVGKSALLDAAADYAAEGGWRVLRTDGTPAEQRLPLAGLHKLLRPVRRELAGLPPARRQTLDSAFGSAHATPDIFAVALACLELLASVAVGAPVAVLIDDAHWLDRSTAEVLAFVARRLAPDPILLLAASRHVDDDPFADAGLPQLDIGPLDGPTAAALLDRTSPKLNAVIRHAVLLAASGNPLALLELPISLPDTSMPEPPSRELPLTRRLEREFLGRTRELPKATQDLLLVAAVNDSGDIAEVVTAAGVLAGGARHVDDLDPAVAEGLVRVDPSTIVFRHPLVRSAVYQGAPAHRRRAAHAALASVVTDQPDRRVWHRASAIIGPNESVAAELDGAAVRAQQRGSVPGALQAFERAAELSGSAATRGRRVLRAAEVAAEAGLSAQSRGYLDLSRPLLTEPEDRLRLELVQEITDESMHGGPGRVDALIRLAEQGRHQQDQDLAIRFLLRAGMRCWHQDFGPDVERRVVAATDQLTVDHSDPRRVVIYAYASPFDRAAEIIDILRRRSPHADDDPADLLMYGYAGACTGAYQEAELFCTAAADRLREQGRLTLLTEALSLLTWSTLRRNRWQVAAPAAEECVRIARDIRQPVPLAAGLAAIAAIAGIRGDDTTADTSAAQAEELATATNNTIGLAVTHLARGLTAAGRGRSEEAFEQFWHLYGPHDPAHQRMQACRTISHLAEAAVRTGHQAEARAELARFEPLAARTPAIGVHVAMRAARAVLAQPEDAEQAFIAALDTDWSDWAFEHGRLLLTYGSWLRRHKQISASRTHLRAALDEFARSGARPWATQARRELRAAGATPTQPTTKADDAWERLSPQEAQIARLVIQGLSNQEIGQCLYLSARTVGSHLYRMFPKLEVTSRAQLAHALGVTGTSTSQLAE